jgi:hypothetical protein
VNDNLELIMQKNTLKNVMLAGVAVVVLGGFGMGAANASVLASFPLNSDFNATNLAGNIASATLDTSTLTSAYIGNDGFGSVGEFYPNSGGTSAPTALTSNSYFSINITSTGGPLNLGVLNYAVAKGGFADPRGYAIYDSLDGFANPLISTQLPTGANTAPLAQSLGLDAAFASATDVTFRFYVYTPNSSAYSVDFANISLETPNAVPEPAALGLFGLGLVGLGLMARKRKTA